MDSKSSKGLQNELLSTAKKYGLSKDPLYMSYLDRYIKLCELQEKYFEAAKEDESKLSHYMSATKEANITVRHLRQRIQDIYGDTFKYSEEVENYREAAKKEYEKKVKSIQRYWDTKLEQKTQEFEKKLKKQEEKIALLDKGLDERVNMYSEVSRDVENRIRAAKKEKEKVLLDLDTTKKELVVIRAEKNKAIKELNELIEKIGNKRGTYNKVKAAEVEPPKPVIDPNGL